MGKVYTIVNQKGGVGKTTTSINLGAYLGIFQQRVLLVDIDPQANATSCLGIDKNSIQNGVYEALIGSQAASDHILHNSRFHLSLLPSSPNLAGAEIELIDLEERETRLRKLIDPLRSRYDYILIDCPPSLGLLTLNGLLAAFDGVIIPVQCEYLALEGLGQLTQTLARVRQSLFPTLDIKGVVHYVRRPHQPISGCDERSPTGFSESRIQYLHPAQRSAGGSALIWYANLYLCPRVERSESVPGSGNGAAQLERRRDSRDTGVALWHEKPVLEKDLTR